MTQIWGQRNLPWKRQIMIIKTLILPQVTHLLGMTFTPIYILERPNKLMFNFLWKNKATRNKRETIIASIKDGGLRMPDIYAFHKAQKIMCMNNLKLGEGKGLSLFSETCGVQTDMLNCKLNEHYLNRFKLNPFHEQLLKCDIIGNDNKFLTPHAFRKKIARQD